MKLTALSFIMSAVWSSIIILVVHLVRRKQFFLNGFGIGTIILLYLFSFGRMFLAIEFPFTYEIPVPEVYNRLYETIKTDHISLGAHGISFIDAFLTLWCLVSFVLVIVFLVRCSSAIHFSRTHHCVHNAKLSSILAKIQSQYSDNTSIEIIESTDVQLPMGIGIFKKRILIPAANYSDSDLWYIILHEYMHFRNKDLPILFLTELFVRLFWWNPFVYLLKSDLRQILEIKCDLSVITGATESQRVNYLQAIQTCLIQSNKLKAKHIPAISSQLFRKNDKKKKMMEQEMLERFRLIAYPVKKNYIFYQTLSIICFVLAMVISYLFILQPQYQPPEEDIYTDSGVGDDGVLAGYIIAKKDGTYIFVDETGFEVPLQKDSLEHFLSGNFDIIEE